MSPTSLKHFFLYMKHVPVLGQQTSSYEITLRPWTSVEPDISIQIPMEKRYAGSVVGGCSVLVV